MTTNVEKCKNEIRRFFSKYDKSIESTLSSRTDAKIYEIYCLHKLLKWIDDRYEVKIEFRSPIDCLARGNGIVLKSGAGLVNRKDFSYFVISSISENGNCKKLEIHTNIEVITIGIDGKNSNAYSERDLATEIDIVLIFSPESDQIRPRYTDLILGIECKLTQIFNKKIINEVIGTRNGISRHTSRKHNFILDEILKTKPKKQKRYVFRRPPSEFWLAQTHDKALRYRGQLDSADVKLYLWRRKL